jgi:hypothetical protein
MDSADASAWKAHCTSCPDCQTEQFLLTALRRQAQSERQHLGQREVAELLEAARLSHERRRRVAPLKAWAWRAASVCLLAGATWQIGRVASVPPRPVAPFVTVVAEAPGPACGNYAVPLYSDSAEVDGGGGQAISPALPAPLPDLAPGQFVQELLQNLRDEIDRRRQEVIDLQDRDAGGWERDDAWELVLPTNLAVA